MTNSTFDLTVIIAWLNSPAFLVRFFEIDPKYYSNIHTNRQFIFPKTDDLIFPASLESLGHSI